MTGSGQVIPGPFTWLDARGIPFTAGMKPPGEYGIGGHRLDGGPFTDGVGNTIHIGDREITVRIGDRLSAR